MKTPILQTLRVSITLITLGTLALGCSHAETKSEAPAEPATAAITNEVQSSDLGNALGLQSIHFDYNSSLLTAAGKALLKKDAAILKENASVRIQIEGHTDSRGGIQYNIALGEKRAQSAQHYLQDRGIPKARITIVSFGKEKPLDSAETEAAYKKNRRACFVIIAK